MNSKLKTDSKIITDYFIGGVPSKVTGFTAISTQIGDVRIMQIMGDFRESAPQTHSNYTIGTVNSDYLPLVPASSASLGYNSVTPGMFDVTVQGIFRITNKSTDNGFYFTLTYAY